MTTPNAALRLGIIGCDTSHATAFAGILNDPAAPNHGHNSDRSRIHIGFEGRLHLL